MNHSPKIPSSFRREVQDYLLSCENLLAISRGVADRPFSTEEIEMVEHYSKQIVKMYSALTAK